MGSGSAGLLGDGSSGAGEVESHACPVLPSGPDQVMFRTREDQLVDRAAVTHHDALQGHGLRVEEQHPALDPDRGLGSVRAPGAGGHVLRHLDRSGEVLQGPAVDHAQVRTGRRLASDEHAGGVGGDGQHETVQVGGPPFRVRRVEDETVVPSVEALAADLAVRPDLEEHGVELLRPRDRRQHPAGRRVEGEHVSAGDGDEAAVGAKATPDDVGFRTGRRGRQLRLAHLPVDPPGGRVEPDDPPCPFSHLGDEDPSAVRSH